MAISLRKPQEIEKLRAANKIVAGALELLKQNTKSGVSLQELDAMAEDYIKAQGARPSFKGLYGFPSTVCTSLNEVINHGIPNDYKLQEGDVIGYDIGTELDGWYGDAAITVGVGEISEEDEKLISCAKETLYEAIDAIKDGMRFKELSSILENSIRSRGFVPLYDFCGHGIGKKPHEEPEIPNYLDGKNPKQGPKIKNGMVFCLEPMICQKDSSKKILENGWDVVSADGLRGSHYEHTVAV
ncbi:MAG: type I methionyl aminopeptidase, partial [Thiovulaceae bacterium]|nr:type I methionyl aminopeptidase [Sulfurimonadaceae bacterium]